MQHVPTQRDWLAAILAGTLPSTLAVDSESADALVACALEEGVVALVHKRLSEDACVSASIRNVFAAAARESAVASLLREGECRRVLAVLQAANIPVLLMKGSALAWWLYPEAYLRECGDIDLLFSSRAQAQEAVRMLAVHGYALNHRPGDLSYELLCRREIGLLHVDLDMHWRLVNVPLFAEMFDFATLHAAAISLPRMAINARGLAPVHAFMHACIHRIVNLYLGISDSLKWLYDLHLLGQQLTPPDWLALQQQAREHGLSAICAAGIDAAAQAFGPVAPETVVRALREASTHEALDAGRLYDWKYMQGRNLAALPSLRVRARWLWQRLFPPVRYMQELYGTDRGAASLFMQRLQRAIRRLRS